MSDAKTQTTPKFPGFVKDKLKTVARQAQNLYRNPATEFLPSLNKFTTQGIANRAEIAGGGSIARTGVDEASKILSGQYLDVTQNPAFQRNINSALGMATDRFAGSGRVGSGAYAGALGDAATGVAAQMFDVERQRQMEALGMLPQLVQSNYADSAALEDAGRALDEDTMARFDWPYARLDRFANTLYGSPASQIPGQSSRTPFNWGSAAMGIVTPLGHSKGG